jgi:Flp pilus assembly pilin Flp
MLPRRLLRLIGDQRAQDLIEYALLLACVALAIVAAVQSLGIAVTDKYGDATTAVATGARGGGNPGNANPGAGTPGQGDPGSGNPGQGNPGGGNPGKGNGNGGGKP